MLSLEALAPGAVLPTGSFLQSSFWSVFKGAYGFRSMAFRFVYRHQGRGQAREGGLRVLLRSLAGPLCFAYVPGGPLGLLPQEERSLLLAELGEALKPRLPRGCLFLRFDPPWYLEDSMVELEGEDGKAGAEEVARPRLDPPLRKTKVDIQPPDSVLLDLARDDAELLAAMKPKWRYNIRLAEKKGVVVEDIALKDAGDEIAFVEGLDLFYALYEETARRDRIAIHPRAYYAKLFEVCADGNCAEKPDLRLWLARHEGRALAAIITLYNCDEAVYLYGASSDEGRSLMPTYALQWAAIRAARVAGCLSYDFYGIPPRADPDHPMAGLYRFKTGFGGRVVHYAGSWDLPLRGLPYRFWLFAEALRAFWYKVALKRLFGR